MSKDLLLAIKAAKKAGIVVKKGFGHVKQIDFKQNRNDFVTEVDRQSEKIIVEVLSKSGYSFLAEEGGRTDNHSCFTWVVDPLDGTRSFSTSIPLFCISIALMNGDDILLGVIFNPLSGELFFAESGKGAFLNGSKLSVSERNFESGSLVFVNSGWGELSRSHYVQAVSRLRNLCSLRYFGTTALELCYVAAGRGDAFMSSGDCLWDYAAGILIVRESSGIVTDWNGKNWNNGNSFILATNRKIHGEISEKIKGIQ